MLFAPSVSARPGTTALTPILRGPGSTASERVMASSKPLVAEGGANLQTPALLTRMSMRPSDL
jgi:hypothetical protein